MIKYAIPAGMFMFALGISMMISASRLEPNTVSKTDKPNHTTAYKTNYPLPKELLESMAARWKEEKKHE